MNRTTSAEFEALWDASARIGQEIWELVAQQDRHEAAGLPSYNGPLFQAVARNQLSQLHAAFKKGDDMAFVLAMNQCAMHELPMPDWLAKEWLRRSRAIRDFKVATWDEVMPAAKPKGRKLAAARLELRWTLAVVQAVHAASDVNLPPDARRPIDEQLFDELAELHRWNFSGAQAKKLYYAARKRAQEGRALFLEMYFDRATAARRPRPRRASTIRRKL